MLILEHWSLYYQQLPTLFLPSEPKKTALSILAVLCPVGMKPQRIRSR
jgi:hypothetical protein